MTVFRRHGSPLVAGAALLLGVVAAAATVDASAVRWGMYGHEIAGRAAATGLPRELPAFFRDATEQLAYLNPEPDRWRGGFRELNEAKRYDHYINFEVIPDSILVRPDRFQFLVGLQQIGLSNPARDAGLLPFRIVEMYQGLVVQWRLWRGERDPVRRGWIEQRIINDAGIMGHYVTDGANPHHTSVHFDGWRADYPNPRGFSTERGFHSRFETQFVSAAIRTEDILPYIRAPQRIAGDVRSGVLTFLRQSFGHLERLYELDRIERFGPETRGAPHRAFAVERLAAGANMLRDLWYTAYLESGDPAGGGAGASPSPAGEAVRHHGEQQ
jgi:hypothetical protein